MQPVVDDPLKKREKFAVSLRKAKTKQIISAKRLRLQQRLVGQFARTTQDQ